MTHRAEVAVVGGGLTGLTTAVALAGPRAARPADVILLDAKDRDAAFKDAFPGRAIAVTASARRMFEAMGVWQAMAPYAQPMLRIVVTDGDADGAERPSLLKFDDDRESGSPSAYMIEISHILAALYAAIEAAPSIRLLESSPATHFDFGPGLARMETANGQAIRVEMIAAADGRNSQARQAAGIAVDGWAYGQTGIVAAIAHEFSHEGRAEEHFLPAGPFAVLPLTGNRSSLVWTETTETAERLLRMNEADCLEELRLRLGNHLGGVRFDGPRRGFPLELRMARSFVGSRLALLGDAAHVIHPIAGLGFNLGLRDVAALADCVADALALGSDIGSDAVLERYARWRRFDTAMAAAATEGLNRLFSNADPALRIIRDLGLRAVDGLKPLKPWFRAEAAGETGHLPRLMRGQPA